MTQVDRGVAVSDMATRAGEQELRTKYLLSGKAARAVTCVSANACASAGMAVSVGAKSEVCECECGEGSLRE